MIFIFLEIPETVAAAICELCFSLPVFPLIQLLPRADAPQRVPPYVLNAFVILDDAILCN